jgi:hypothetical protein
MCNPLSLLSNGNAIAATNKHVTNVGRVVFYAGRAVSKDSNRLVLHINYFKILLFPADTRGLKPTDMEVCY